MCLRKRPALGFAHLFGALPTLGGNDHFHHTLCVLLHLVDPLVEALERGAFLRVVHDHHSSRLPIIRRRQRVELLLARSVPHLHS